MLIHTHANARAGLIGNPSDGYFGKTISIIIRNFAARVTCYESPRLNIVPAQCDHSTFDSLDALADDVARNGYYGGMRLLKAAVKRFNDHCRDNGIRLDKRNFTLEYATDIPIRVGLAGSSGIVTATMRALMTFYGIDIPKPVLPNLILSVELDELGIGAGLQDRVIQVYEGCVYMNFDKALMDHQGYGEYVSLPCENLPPLFVAYHDSLAEGTEVTHNDLRSRFNRGDKEVHAAIAQFAGFAEQAKDLIVAGRGGEIGPLLRENFQLRCSIINVSEGNRQLVAIAEKHGASAKLAGSGGAVIGCYDGDPARFAAMQKDYEAMGAKLIDPKIG